MVGMESAAGASRGSPARLVGVGIRESELPEEGLEVSGIAGVNWVAETS